MLVRYTLIFFILAMISFGCSAVSESSQDNETDGDTDGDVDGDSGVDGDAFEADAEPEFEADTEPEVEQERDPDIDTDGDGDPEAEAIDEELEAEDPCLENLECRELGRLCINDLGVARCGDCSSGFKEIEDECRMDFTFFAMGDPQYGGGPADKNDFQIAAMNAFSESEVWPEDSEFSGEEIDEAQGVIIAGDLTQNGRDGRYAAFVDPEENQIGDFLADYGLDGTDGKLKVPVYEGCGNHDYEPDEPGDESVVDWRYYYTENPTPAVDAVAMRNEERVGISAAAEFPAGHYSWDWGWVHFVNVNVFPGDEASDADETSLTRDPRKSLTFLREDLERHVGDSGRPVIVIAHYGFDSFSSESRWWTDAQREAFLEVIAPYNLIAYIHGHVHATHYYEEENINFFNVGSPYYESSDPSSKGHFTVFRITEESFEAHDAAWTQEAEGLDPHFSGWRFVESLGR